MSGQPGGTIFDPGLQPERTELAWRRTVLTIAVGALVALRLLPAALGTLGLSAAVAGLVLAAGLWVSARHRSRLTTDALLHHTSPPGAGLLLLLAVLTTGGAALALAYVTVH
jgi:uncharacterized membrane protein YidH (DUF202 family)